MNDRQPFKPPFFIVGAARSGTTLLQYMLRSHPEVSLPTSESHFFIPFYERREEYGNLSEIGNIRQLLTDIHDSRKRFFEEDLHGIRFDVESLAQRAQRDDRHTVPGVIATIFEANAEAEGKRRWGDKTPYYALHCETLLQMFPGAQFIHLIRDGRDCALSMLQRKRDLQIFNVYHAAYIWNRYVQSAREFGAKHPDNYFELRYEDLLDSPQETMKSLCDFLGIEFSHSVIDFRKSSGAGKTPLLTKPLQKSNQGKWRKSMSRRDLEIFESLAGETLEKCGYELSTTNPKISRMAWVFYETHIRLSHFKARHFGR